jgi:hypothetical protein
MRMGKIHALRENVGTDENIEQVIASSGFGGNRSKSVYRVTVIPMVYAVVPLWKRR